MKYYYMIGDYQKCTEKGGLAAGSFHKEMAEQLAEEWGCEGSLESLRLLIFWLFSSGYGLISDFIEPI